MGQIRYLVCHLLEYTKLILAIVKIVNVNIIYIFASRFFKKSLEFTLFFRNPQLFLGTVKCCWEPWDTLSNPQELSGIWYELQLEPKQMKSNDWSIYFRKIDRMVEVWIKIWKITRDEMWRRYHKSWANLNAGSFLQLHQISPTGLPENRLNSILNDHIQMICLCKYTTAIALIPQHIKLNNFEKKLFYVACLNLFLFNIESFSKSFHFHPPHLFVVSKEAFIVRSACSAAADEVFHMIIICIVMIMIIIIFSPYQWWSCSYY